MKNTAAVRTPVATSPKEETPKANLKKSGAREWIIMWAMVLCAEFLSVFNPSEKPAGDPLTAR